MTHWFKLDWKAPLCSFFSSSKIWSLLHPHTRVCPRPWTLIALTSQKPSFSTSLLCKLFSPAPRALAAYAQGLMWQRGRSQPCKPLCNTSCPHSSPCLHTLMHCPGAVRWALWPCAHGHGRRSKSWSCLCKLSLGQWAYYTLGLTEAISIEMASADLPQRLKPLSDLAPTALGASQFAQKGPSSYPAMPCINHCLCSR